MSSQNFYLKALLGITVYPAPTYIRTKHSKLLASSLNQCCFWAVQYLLCEMLSMKKLPEFKKADSAHLLMA